MNTEELSNVFSALSDATRRSMLSRLADGESNVRTLADCYEISQPAISKHLRVLERAGLVKRAKRGRESIVKADPKPMEDAADWIRIYASYWRTHFDAVEEYLSSNGKILVEGARK